MLSNIYARDSLGRKNRPRDSMHRIYFLLLLENPLADFCLHMEIKTPLSKVEFDRGGDSVHTD